MRFIGSKSLLLSYIKEEIEKAGKVRTILDIFSGSGIVSSFLVQSGYEVTSNDFLYFSYVLLRGTIGLKEKPSFNKLGIADIFGCLNNLRLSDTKYELADCFIYSNYSPHESCERMYFQRENAIKIDVIRKQIEDWKESKIINEDEYYYLLASLINAIPYVSNITGTYGAYLKYWDKRTYNPLTLKEPEIEQFKNKVVCYNVDYKKFPRLHFDLLYADPPYNSREYLPNYHILETVAKYDNPKIKGKTGIREYSEQKSDFCKKDKVEQAFDTLICNSNVDYILISYNNEGILSTEKLCNLCESYSYPGTFHLKEIEYRRYKNKIPNNKAGLKELLIFFKKK